MVLFVNRGYAVCMFTALLALSGDAWARGGGFRGGGGGGGARPAMPSARPSMPQARPNLPAARPSIPSRPSVPNLGGARPGMTRPASPGLNRPATPAPSVRPSVVSPGGGLKPNPRPALPATRPGGTGPAVVRPGVTQPGQVRPDVPGTVPGNATRPARPSFPDLGGTPGKYPGVTTRTDGDRPVTSRPQTKPALPGGTLPGRQPRPNPGALDDFLGLDKPLRPGGTVSRPTIRPGELPGGGTRPVVPSRPGVSTLPGITNRPGEDRPGINWPGGGRPGQTLPGQIRPGGDHPWKPDTKPWQPGGTGDWRPGQLPAWANRPGWTQAGNNWASAVTRPNLGNWSNLHPDRVQVWNQWGNNLRNHWNFHIHHNNWFHGEWWNQHHMAGFHYQHWHYGWCFHRHPWRYWWTVPSYVAMTQWFTWSAPASVWQTPIYYDYGTGGNVTTDNSVVYLDGQAVGSAADVAASAAGLSAVAPPASEAAAEAAEWLPLGTFAVSSHEDDVQPQRVIQLAVNKEGVVSGTLYNTTTDTAQTVLGQVDKSTQRVAMRIGETDVVAETGLYNLTLDNAPTQVHFGADRDEIWLLVRLEEPDEPEDASAE